MNYNQLQISEFNNILSSNKPMPGGGVAVSIISSIGVALSLKVINLTIGKKKYEEYKDLHIESKNKLECSLNKFYKLADLDATNFMYMTKVYKMPNETDIEKQKKAFEMEQAAKNCIVAPKENILEINNCIQIINSLIGKTNKLAESDLLISKNILEASKEASKENININLNYINDIQYKQQLNDILNID